MLTAVTATDLKRLSDPFAPDDIEWRIGQSGKKGDRPWATVLAYITNRAIQNRLDEVCGPARWRNLFERQQIGETVAVLCGISIWCSVGDEAQWVTKWDGAEETDIESVKGGLSSAMKRAAVQWGIGRYLYDLPSGFATIHEGGKNFAKTKDGVFRWDPPAIPSKFLPAAEHETAEAHVQPVSEEILSLIRTAYKQIPKDYTTRIEGTDQPLRAWIRANSARLETDPDLALQISELCQHIE
jgi:hypothetical protein